MLFGRMPRSKSGDIIKSTDNNDHPDGNWIHVALFDFPSTFLEMGAESGNENRNAQQIDLESL